MDIHITKDGYKVPIYSDYEWDLIHRFRSVDEAIKNSDEIPIAQLVAMALHYHKGVFTTNAQVLYPVLIPKTFEEDSEMVWDFVEAWQAPWPSETAKLVGMLIEIAYYHEDQRLAVEEKLRRIGETCECINEHHMGWNLPTFEKIGEVWQKLIQANTPDFHCVFMTQAECDTLVRA